MLVSIAIEDIVCRGDAHLIASDSLNVRLARSALADLQALGPLPDLRRRIEQAERFTVLDEMTAFASGRVDLAQILDGSGDSAFDIVANAANALTDWDLVLQDVNEWYDRAAAALEQPTYAKQAAALEQVEDDLEKVGEGLLSARSPMETFAGGRTRISQRVGDLFVCLSLPAAMSPVHIAEQRGTAMARLSVLGYGLAAYRAEHGEYPRQLEQLVPDYLPELPMDPFNDKPFSYQTKDKGFLLHSFGPNSSLHPLKNQFHRIQAEELRFLVLPHQ
jgi:hypothetical protein